MAASVIIPARYGSTRLPRKPLLSETGKPLIQHVVEAVRPARKIDRVVVATDDERIAEAVRSFGGEAVLTDPGCRSGTDRLAEAAGKLRLPADDIVVNVQGDEPEMPAACVDRLVELIEACGLPMATLTTPLDAAEAGDPSKVKVVVDRNGRALYFSRAKIPHPEASSGRGRGDVQYLLHLGIYAYRVEFLKTFAALPSTPAERAERLEQLRALEHGYAIAVATVDYAGAGIDTPADYRAFVESLAKRKEPNA